MGILVQNYQMWVHVFEIIGRNEMKVQNLEIFVQSLRDLGELVPNLRDLGDVGSNLRNFVQCLRELGDFS